MSVGRNGKFIGNLFEDGRVSKIYASTVAVYRYRISLRADRE
jgi:hypothetical protein